jgi:hypothetical protein
MKRLIKNFMKPEEDHAALLLETSRGFWPNENWLMAASNIVALLPLYDTLFYAKDTVTFLIVLNVALASFFSHLFECHKHGMPGYGLSPHTSFLLNRWDVVGCVLLIIRFVYLCGIFYLFNPIPIVLRGWFGFTILAIGYVFNHISEYDMYNPDRKYIYIPCHFTWHILAFVGISEVWTNLF